VLTQRVFSYITSASTRILSPPSGLQVSSDINPLHARSHVTSLRCASQRHREPVRSAGANARSCWLRCASPSHALQFLGGMRMFLDHCWCARTCQCIALTMRISLFFALPQGAARIERWFGAMTWSRHRYCEVFCRERRGVAMKQVVEMIIKSFDISCTVTCVLCSYRACDAARVGSCFLLRPGDAQM
jgi:hypothetical protein